MNAKAVNATCLREMLADGHELALVDVREERIFSEGHLLHARSLPLSRLELRIRSLIPRFGTRVVLCDEADGLAERAASILAAGGYTDLRILEGGIAAWAEAGLELFSGVNVPSKAFGEFIEHACNTPSIAAAELNRLLSEQADLVVLDSRPFDEYARVSIPGAINVPGAELVLRVRDLAPRAETTIVVNCAGRTRSIIGAQSLINAGVPNKVMALRNGTMGWQLAGLTCDSGKDRRPPNASGDAEAWAKAAAEQVARRCGVEHIDRATLARWRADGEERTTYVFDVRDPAEYEAGHIPGAISAPGGQLVQATDQYVGTLGARIILCDDKEARALMTASWLRQMGWKDVFVLAESGDERGWPEAPVLGPKPSPEVRIDAATLAALLAQEEATVIDLSLSREYAKAHIPGAWFAIRSRLERAFKIIPLRGTLVLTSEDGILAGLAVREARALTAQLVRFLDGGNEAWRKAGHPLTAADPKMADEPDDVWLKPYERAAGVPAAMVEYLSWETDLPVRIARDGSTRFSAA
ncbi:MAG TPA: rhodanese-like domain-containing protein [Xanthobacteraceae bacterium]|nr:rhodanese-like domain-containing protein [Xanthobacteraceae bacterium]